MFTLDGSHLEIDAFNMFGTKTVMANADTRIYYLQAAHTFGINTSIYGNNFTLQGEITNSLLAAFW